MFQKQAIMRRVVYSLVPIFLYSVYLYGWRVVAVTAVVYALGILTEFVVEKSRNKKVSEAVLVTCGLFALSLPPGVPLWIAAVGIVFAVLFGKEVFGGFGRNIFNPAITGRLFVYLAFPLLMQTTWMVPGAFGTLATNNMSQGSTIVEAGFVLLVVVAAFVIIRRSPTTKVVLLTGIVGIGAVIALYVATGYGGLLRPEIDAVATATPLEIFRGGSGSVEALNANDPLRLFFGLRVGSIGESAVFLIVAAGVYLLVTKTANRYLMLSTLFGALLVTVAFYAAGWMVGRMPMMDPSGRSLGGHVQAIASFMMSGSLLFVTVFMATDPVSGPNKPAAQVIYGIIIGAVTVIIRSFSGFPEGTSFAVLVANVFASLIDELVPAPKKKNAAAAKKPAVSAATNVEAKS